jgi:hypothetical protein
MPYSNVSEDKQDAMHRCVQKVMAGGQDKQSAIAICYTSIMGKESAPQFTIYKQADGTDRWLLVSSNAYRDHDGEIVSQKAQADDVARMDATGNYGPLRWWHVPGLDIGKCDFVAMQDRMRVESGTFASKEIGEQVAGQVGNLAVSLGFTHAESEPDASGVYHTVNVFERSLLPRGKAANPYTFVSVKEMNDMATLKEKWGQFVSTVFSGDEGKAKEFVAGAEETAKAIEGAGVAFKEEKAAGAPVMVAAPMPDGETEDEGVMLEDATVAELEAMLASKKAEMETKAACEPKVKEGDEVVTTKRGGTSGPGERAAMFANLRDAGNYDEGELGSAGRGAASDSPRGSRVKRTAQGKVRKPKKKELDEGGGEADIDITIADLTPDEFVAVMSDWLQPVTKELAEVKTTKEAEATTLKQALETIATLETRLADLEGAQPRAWAGFRPSRAGAEPTASVKAARPGPSQSETAVKESDGFVSWAIGGSK